MRQTIRLVPASLLGLSLSCLNWFSYASAAAQPQDLFVPKAVVESGETVRVADNSGNPLSQSDRPSPGNDDGLKGSSTAKSAPLVAEPGAVPVIKPGQPSAKASINAAQNIPASQLGVASYLTPNTQTVQTGVQSLQDNVDPKDITDQRTTSLVKPVSFQKSAPSITTQIEVPEYIILNQPAKLRIKLQNHGEVAATSVKLLATIPEHVKFAGSTPAPTDHQGRLYQFEFPEIGGQKTCELIINLIPLEKKAIDIGTEVLVENIQRFSVSVREPKIKLSLEGPEKVDLGQKLVHKVMLENTGDGVAQNIVLRPMFPSLLRHEQKEQVLIPALEPGQKMDVALPSLATSAGQTEFAVSIAAEGVELQTAKTTLVIHQPELKISASGPQINFLNREGIYSIVLANTGEVEATNVIVDLQMPPGIKVTTISHPATVNPETGKLTWNLNRISPKSVQTLKLLTLATKPGSQDCIISVRSQQTSDATINLITNVVTRPELNVKLQNQSGPVPVGGKVQFLVAVENTGSKSAENIAIKILLPTALVANSEDEAGKLSLDRNLVFNSSKLEPGQKEEFRFVAVANEKGEHVVRTILNTSAFERELTSEGAAFVYELNENRVSESLAPALVR